MAILLIIWALTYVYKKSWCTNIAHFIYKLLTKAGIHQENSNGMEFPLPASILVTLPS
jgi:hypothetical protein